MLDLTADSIVGSLVGEIDSSNSLMNTAKTERIQAVAALDALRPTKPTQSASASLSIASFDTCNNVNATGGTTGAAFEPPNSLKDEYIASDTGPGCMARLTYTIANWAAFFLKTPGVTLAPYRHLCFDSRVEAPSPNWQMKIELKRANGQEQLLVSLTGFTDQWQNSCINLSDFGPGDGLSLTGNDIEEITFVVERQVSGDHGIFYLDNIKLTS